MKNNHSTNLKQRPGGDAAGRGRHAGLALAVMGLIIGVVFWRQGQRLNLPERR